MRKLVALAVAVSACLLVAGRADGAFTWLVNPTVNAPISIKYNDWEEIVHNGVGGNLAPTAAGDLLQGLVQVTSITQGTTTLWSNSTPGQSIVGYFNGLVATGPATGGPPAFAATFTGAGTAAIKLFFSDGTTPFDPTYSTNDSGAIGHGTGYDGAVNPSLAAWLTATAVTGIDGPSIVLESINFGVGGAGESYWTVVDGSMGGLFVKDGEDPTHALAGSQDLFLNSTVQPDNNPYGWPANSFDPLQGVTVPEPISLLVWSGLMAIGAGGAFLRRKTRIV